MIIADNNSNMNDFQYDGLLVEGCPGDGDAGACDKFTQAQQVLGMVGGAASIKEVLRRKREPGPATVFEEELVRRVKVHVKKPQSPSPIDFPGPRTFIDLFVSPQVLSCPRSGGNGEGVIAT